MTQCYVASACLTASNGQVAAVFDRKHQKTQIIDNSAWLTILELFIHERSVEVAYQRFQTIPPLPVFVERLRQQLPVRGGADTVLLQIADHSLQVMKNGVHLDCSAASRHTCQVLTALFHQAHFVADASTIGTMDAFSQAVHHLVRLGLLSPAQNTIEWGDLRRTAPFCPVFGLTRGTPGGGPPKRPHPGPGCRPDPAARYAAVVHWTMVQWRACIAAAYSDRSHGIITIGGCAAR